MRAWLVVVLLAGCAQPVHEPPDHRLLLLGADACVGDVCRVAADDLGTFLRVPQRIQQVALVGNWTVWSDDTQRVAAYDRASKQFLELLLPGPGDVRLAADGAVAWLARTTATGDTRLSSWTPEQSAPSPRPAALDGRFDLLDARGGKVLLAAGVPGAHLAQMVLQDEAGRALVRFDGGDEVGRAVGAIGEDFVLFGFGTPDAPTRLWVHRGDSVSALWTTYEDVVGVFAVRQHGVVAGKDWFQAIDINRGTEAWRQEGRLLGFSQEAPLYATLTDFGGGTLRLGRGPLGQDLADLAGRVVLASAVDDDAALLAVSGHERALAHVPLG